jgi:hypothetical protein
MAVTLRPNSGQSRRDFSRGSTLAPRFITVFYHYDRVILRGFPSMRGRNLS